MQGARRRIVYLTLFEAFAIVLSSIGMSMLMDIHPAEAGIVSIAASIIAVLWNLVYNMAFEAWEARRGATGRGLAIRVVHAFGFEGGLVLMLVPLVAWMLGISIVEAFLLDLGLIVFFLFYTFLFNLGFDRVFGLPNSAKVDEKKGGRPLPRAC